MKTKKLLARIKGILDGEAENQLPTADSLNEVLEKLRAKEAKFVAKYKDATAEKQSVLEQKLKIIRAQILFCLT